MIVTLKHPDYWIRLASIRRTQERWHRYPWTSSFLYFSLVREIAATIWPDGVPPYYFQREPNLRIQPPGETCVPWHKDSDFGHLEEEWNCWMPLTEITDESQTVWVDEGPHGKAPIMLQPGQAFLFPGAAVTHGNVPNATDRTRRSMDFRLIEQKDFRDLDIRTVEYGMRLKVGDYWREWL